MNNKRYTYKWLLLIPMLMFFSCTQEDLPGTDKIQEYDGISFLVSMAIMIPGPPGLREQGA